jgi:sugar lactone lactonase YvrE
MRGIMIIVASLLAMQVSSAPVPKLPAWQTEKVLELRPLIDISEGIAIDHRGHIYITNRRLENDKRVPEILEIALDGTVSVFATLDSAGVDAFDEGPAGLAFDSRGDLYVALISFNPRKRGVWRVRRDGAPERLAGSQRILIPNALAFDSRGNLYVTDSADGAVWRFPRERRGRRWIRHPLLAPEFLVGANGIAFVPPDNLYVANLDRALIARIRIRPDGSPAEPEIAAAGFELLGIDGLAADARGMLYACIVLSVAFGTSPVVQVDPKTGTITSSTTDTSAFDLPTSLAFGRGPLDHKSVYVVNSGLFPEGRPEAAPGVVRVGVRANGPR